MIQYAPEQTGVAIDPSVHGILVQLPLPDHLDVVARGGDPGEGHRGAKDDGHREVLLRPGRLPRGGQRIDVRGPILVDLQLLVIGHADPLLGAGRDGLLHMFLGAFPADHHHRQLRLQILELGQQVDALAVG